MSIDYEVEYNNRARVPEHGAIMAAWPRDAAAWREAIPPRVIAYGAGERHVFDFFEAGQGPAIMFVHGGYWQATDKSSYSHMARGLNMLGVSVAVPSYDLCPGVRIGDIVAQISAACAELARETGKSVVVSGHSAGGHLAACMLATQAYVHAAFAISGLFDLRPLVGTSINAALRMDEEEAERLSPMFWPPPVGKTLDAVVGAEESSEYLRQSATIVRAWGEAGVATRYEEIENANHFTVIAPLAEASSDMCGRLKQLADSASRCGL